MRLLSFLLVLALSYVSSATLEGKICPQGGSVPPECPNNYKWNSITCRFECKPHCISNEDIFIFPASNGTTFRQKCNSCVCQPDGTAICTRMGCPSNVCYDETGAKYPIGSTMISHCRTGTCTNVNGKATWSWYTPASATIKPNCPYGPGIFNNDTCKWECPRTCPDGSTPRKCSNGGLPPCSVVRCGGFNSECTDNYCPNYPNNNRGACTATCVAPALCTKDPCQAPVGKPKCGKNQICQADYRFGCGYQCSDITCEYNQEIYQIGEKRASEDNCNTCTCTENGDWACTEKLCVKPSDKPICIQGGTPPPQCPNNNQWNSVTCQFECVCPQNQNCGINGAWDYDQCRCVVPSPSPCPQNQNCGINGVWDYNTCRCVVNTPSPSTCPTPQEPRCDFAPAVLNQTSCKWFCPQTCSDGSQPVNCLINPCAATTCFTNTQCVANYCGGCNGVCKPIETTVNCLVAPCSVNSCANGQTCVNDYAGGCNYRCI